jgi:hypothetical protein
MKEKILKKITNWMDEGYSGRSLTLKYTSYMDKLLADIYHSIDRKCKPCSVGNRWIRT